MSSLMENIIYPEQFKTQYIYVYKQFNDELKELIEKSGYKQEFTRKYRKALKFLEALKQECIKYKEVLIMINYELLENPMNIIDELADNETKKLFDLDDILVNISLKLINYRIDNKLTQKELSKKLSISQSMVSKLESGEYNPTVEQLWKVCDKLNWKFDILIDNELKPTQIWEETDENFNEIKLLSMGA